VSATDPSQAEAALSGVVQAVQTVEPAAAAALAISNPQAAAVLQATSIGVAQLTQLVKQLQAGQAKPADVSARATQIAAAIASTHQAWDALNQPLPTSASA